MEKLKFHYSYRDHWSKVTRTFDTREEVSKFIQERWNENHSIPISMSDILYSPCAVESLRKPTFSVSVRTHDGPVNVGIVYETKEGK